MKSAEQREPLCTAPLLQRQEGVGTQQKEEPVGSGQSRLDQPQHVDGVIWPAIGARRVDIRGCDLRVICDRKLYHREAVGVAGGESVRFERLRAYRSHPHPV
jgi:hypothetical protein